MSFGEVDTLGMLFDKLQTLFDESQGYYESFLDTNNMYKKGQLSDKEFFQKLNQEKNQEKLNLKKSQKELGLEKNQKELSLEKSQK